jgi:hypothetical protein
MSMRGIAGTRVLAWVIGIGVGAALGTGAARASEKWADSLFAELSHDFGPVPRGAIVRHNFVLTNRFNEAITILDVRASCGCTTGRVLATNVAPGQQTAIEALMDTRNFVGKKATTLTISLVSASGRQAEVRLGVQSTILSDIVLNPGTIDLGVVSRGQTAQQILTIDRHGAPGWRVEKMQATRRLSAVVNAEVVETGRSPQGVSYRLTVNLRPDAPAGPIREEIRILTNDPESPVVPVLVKAEVRGALTASPSLLALGRATSSGEVKGRILLRGAKPFAITKIEGAGEGFEAHVDEPNSRKALHVLTVVYKPEAGKGTGYLRRAFRVSTDLTGEPALDVQATVTVP